ncbi:hypothetical protein HF1_04440 [Mycoplasma haemofelis str. Langford 1]|uniref:Uncharacterized protein n=1 Tax=Mycoplasma haemofelis (strain Langford 1) TaxID=941640 RepID=E8ZH31_MYCHL|nr:hypothetical protein [Mycoplasma haemofelis]CBY92452.1 hypothetical protein HF1_04440 [Mycoplasma haemofelis str. Langford 1]
MNPTLAKSLAALAGTAAVGTGGALAFSQYSTKIPNTVAYHLENTKKLRLISSLSTSEVDAQWTEEYKLNKEEIKKVIQGIDGNDSNGGTKLKEWCESQLSKDFKSDSDLSKEEKWCTIGKISQRIPKGKTIISGESTSWTSVYDSQSQKEDRSKLKLAETKDGNTKNDDLSKIKKFCEDTKDKDFLASKKEDEYDLFIKWCISPTA